LSGAIPPGDERKAKAEAGDWIWEMSGEKKP